MKGWLRRRVRFLKATFEEGPDVRRVSVELQRPDEAGFVGRAARPSGGTDSTDLARAGAEAAAEAVGQASGIKDAEVTVQALERVSMFGKDIVVVSVSAQYKGQTFTLFGVAQIQDDAATAGALAVLSATNRVLELS